MKNWKIVLGMLILAIMVSACVRKESPTGGFADGKMLIVYYSLTGNTEFVAEQIQLLTGADVFKLELTEPYSEDFQTTITRLNSEREAGILPKLNSRADNLADYDTVFLGTPNWFGTLSTPLLAFLASEDLSGKTIVPFITFGRGGLQNTITDLKAALPDSTILEELGITGNEVEDSHQDISLWLNKIGMLKD